MTFRENFMHGVFVFCAATSIIAVFTICFFLFAGGIPAMQEIGIFDFIAGTRWKPASDEFGILPMILGSVYVTLGAMVVGVPLGILAAVFMARFCPARLHRVLKPFVELLAGIPSVVYGFLGLMVLVPAVRFLFGGSGTSLLAASLVLGIMILPTIIGVAESALRSVPEHYYEGALALGATHERAVFSVVLPAAKSGVIAAIILGIGRAVGETMAVIMVAGNQAIIPHSIVRGARTLTANIVLEMGYATDLHRDALIATGVVLFVFVLVINAIFSISARGAK